MNKKQLIEQIAEQAELSQKQADSALKVIFEALSTIMMSNDSVLIPGFGSFSSKVRSARQGRNPNTGEPIQIAEARVPYFKASSQLKAAVNDKTSS